MARRDRLRKRALDGATVQGGRGEFELAERQHLRRRAFLVTINALGVAFLLSVLVGLPLGLLLGRWKLLADVFEPNLDAIYATPRVVIVPLIILWFEPSPEVLARWHTLALAGGAPAAERLRREAEELELDLVDDPDRPLLTLLGPGGIGKSRLALALANDQLAAGAFPGGVFFVPLEPLDRSDDIPVAILEALGAAARANETSFDAVVHAVGDRKTLLLLDNFDLLTSGAAVVAELLAACSELFVLATSRERLELEEESAYPLTGLEVPYVDAPPERAAQVEAVQLFIERARRSRLDFLPDPADLSAIVGLCRRLAGAPLAIELAAVWIREATPTELARDVARSLDRLATPSRTPSPTWIVRCSSA